MSRQCQKKIPSTPSCRDTVSPITAAPCSGHCTCEPTGFADLDAAAWSTAPVGLAWIVGNEIRQANDAATTLLRDSVGKDGSAWRLWLVAAVRRLEAAGRQREIVTASRARKRCLEIAVGPALSGGRGNIVAVRDATAEVATQNEKSETISTLSHELRTPLTSIKNSVALVLDGETGDLSDHQRRFLELTMRNINRLDRLIVDLLDAARAEAGVLAIHHRPVDLSQLLGETLEPIALTGKQKNIDLDYCALPDAYPATVDADKIIQIVHNIVGNAMKYTDDGGHIRVRLKGHHDQLPPLTRLLVVEYCLDLHTFTLVVEDDGAGMSRRLLARIFERFERGPHLDQQQVAGTGLGLHITRQLVEAQGGVIDLSSVPGQGTTVRITLPRDPASQQVLLAVRALTTAIAAAGPDDVRLMALDIRRADGTPPTGDLVAAATAARRFLERLTRTSDGYRQPREHGEVAPSDPFGTAASSGLQELAPGFWIGVFAGTTGVDDAWEHACAAADSPSLLAGSQWEPIACSLPDETPAQPGADTPTAQQTRPTSEKRLIQDNQRPQTARATARGETPPDAVPNRTEAR